MLVPVQGTDWVYANIKYFQMLSVCTSQFHSFPRAFAQAVLSQDVGCSRASHGNAEPCASCLWRPGGSVPGF